MQHKFENPVRLAELQPTETLQKLGLNKGSVFCDIGAGTGIFTFAAVQITDATVYAVDVSQDMLQILRQKNIYQNVIIADDINKVPNESCDLVLLCTVLHEVKPPTQIVEHIQRILKPAGQVAIIEFFKKETPMGPPIERRLSEEDVTFAMMRQGFSVNKSFILGENFYCMVFVK